MFNNCGKKLKVLAYVIFALETLSGLIGGWSVHEASYHTETLGIIIMILSPILGWLSSIVIYTIGDISETVDSIAYRVDSIAYHVNTSEKESSEPYGISPSGTPVYYNNAPVTDSWTCPNCGAKCNTKECDECGYRKQ